MRMSQDIVTAFYGGTLTVIGVLVTFMWHYCHRNLGLLTDAMSQEQGIFVGKHYLVGPIGYAVSTLCAFISAWIAISLFVALNAFFLWPHRHKA